MGYQPDQWHSLFEAIAGASATLAGLIFVAVSLNLKQILPGRVLPSVAARSLAVLVALVLMCTFGLAPGQQRGALGAEILTLGVVLFAGVMITTLRTMTGEEPDGDDGEVHDIHLSWRIGHIAIALQCTVPMVVAGASLLAGAGGGLYWALAEIVCGLIASVTYAWVLLVEILR
jgi:modulator of FtsH protease